MRPIHRVHFSLARCMPRNAACAAVIAACVLMSGARAEEPAAVTLAAQDAANDTLPMAMPLSGHAPPALDDKVLSSQRGGAAGFMMISGGGPLLTRGNGVTLWDEIAPPLPIPQPSDAARTAQGNNVTYVRK